MKKKEKKQKLLQLTSTQLFSPFRDVKDGIIITKDKRYVKLLEFSPVNFGLRSHSEQDQIIHQFAAAIRTMPTRVQFKVVSRHADSSGFIDKIKADMEQEENEGCRRLQRDQINLISSVSAQQGISRKFYVAFEYEEPLGVKHSPSFEQVKSQLERETKSIASSMSQCGNELLSRDTSEYVLEQLYSIMCRREAEERPYGDREFEVISRYVEHYGPSIINDHYIPINDFICPKSIDAKSSPRYLVIDGLYYMFCYVPSSAYPTRAVGGWLSFLINMGEGIDIDFWFNKEAVESTQRKLQYMLRYNNLKIRDTEDTAQDYDGIVGAIEAGYYLKQGIANNEDFCYFGTAVTITATSLEELKYRYTEIRKYCVKKSLKLKTCWLQQLEAFTSTLPICAYDPGIWAKSRRNILTNSLASTYPFGSYEMSDENGILLGTNHDNGSLVYVDIFDTRKYNNANVAILGSSGAGKTYTLECMALRMRQRGIQVFVIAPLKGHEFRLACDAVGGAYVKIAPGSGNNINIMEIRKKEETEQDVLDMAIASTEQEESILMKKIQQLHVFFTLLVKDISYEEKQLLDEALIRTYENFGITSDNSSLLDPENSNAYRKMPILGDLHVTLGELPGAGRLYSILTRYITGSAKSFNQPTNVNLDNKYVVLDVSTLTDEMLPIGMFLALDYVWDKARESRLTKKVIFIDETWKLVGAKSSPQAANFVLEIFKVIRGYGGSAVAATQDLNDFFALDNGAYGAGIINNSKTKLLMKTEPSEAETVARVMELTSEETKEIKNLTRGTCLLAANYNHIFIDIKASNQEHNLITTDREDIAQMNRKASRATTRHKA